MKHRRHGGWLSGTYVTLVYTGLAENRLPYHGLRPHADFSISQRELRVKSPYLRIITLSHFRPGQLFYQLFRMDSLPTEIVRKILTELKPPLASYTSVKQQWKEIIEETLWSSIKINLDEIEKFRTLFRANGVRRQCLKGLDVTLRDYFSSPPEGFESEESEQESSDGNDQDSENNAESDEVDEDSEENIDEDEEAHEDDKDDEDNEDDEDEEAHEVDEDNKNDEHHEDFEDYEGVNKYSDAILDKRLAVFTDEHLRFFQELETVLVELASWKDDLKVAEFVIVMEGESIYELLGRKFRKPAVVERHFHTNAWMYPVDMPQLPALPNITSFTVWSSSVDLWPAIVACQVTRTFPALQRLDINGHDFVKIWYHTRRKFRQGASLLCFCTSS
jgi:hypothetical protein